MKNTKKLLIGLGLVLVSGALFIFKKSTTEVMEEFVTGSLRDIQRNKNNIGLELETSDGERVYAVVSPKKHSGIVFESLKIGQKIALRGLKTVFDPDKYDKPEIIEVQDIKL